MRHISKRAGSALLIVLLLVSFTINGWAQEQNAQLTAKAADWRDFPHPYLLGTISEETGEVTITGIKGTKLVYDWYEDEYVYAFDDTIPRDIVIPDEIDGHPVTEIADEVFNFESTEFVRCENHIRSVTIGDNVRRIGSYAFAWNLALETVSFGKNVQVIERMAFETCRKLRVLSWGDSLREIQFGAFTGIKYGLEQELYYPPLPPTIEFIGSIGLRCQDQYVIPASMKKYYCGGIIARSLIVLSKDMEISASANNPLIQPLTDNPDTYDPDAYYIYCYSGSTAEENAKIHGYTYYLIDGDSLLWDGEAVEDNVLHLDRGMTEAQLRAHLSIDGDSSEIQIEGLKDGKVVNGTTVTLFHKIAQAPGKVYTVEKEPEIVSVSVETLPKTNYFYKETFDPDGLSLRVTYDDGTEKVVTDSYTLTGTELKLGTNTITATYENVSTTFPVTVRYAWWQHLIRIFLLGFLWY